MGMAKSTTCPKRRRRKWNRHTLIAYIATFSQAMHTTSSTSFSPFVPWNFFLPPPLTHFPTVYQRGRGRGLLFLHPLALLPPPPPFRTYVRLSCTVGEERRRRLTIDLLSPPPPPPLSLSLEREREEEDRGNLFLGEEVKRSALK